MDSSKRNGKSAAYQTLNLGAQLRAPGFSPANSSPITLEPVVATPMEVTLDQLQPYSLNPRTTRNPKYDEIKDSIRSRGLDQVPPISRRPGDTLFTIVNGGNTRLAILRELYAETQNPDFYRLQCLYRPWQSEASALIGHLVENEQRGEMSFIEKAVAIRQAQGLLQEQLGEKLSQRKLSETLKAQGIEMSPTLLNRMFQCLDYLLPSIPGLLYGGLGKPQIERALQLRSQGLQMLEHSGKRISEEQLTARFNHALAELEDEGSWDFDALKSSFAQQLGLLLGIPYSHAKMELDTLAAGERTGAIPPVQPPPIVPAPTPSKTTVPTAPAALVVPAAAVPSQQDPVITSIAPVTEPSQVSVVPTQEGHGPADSPIEPVALPDGRTALLPNEVVRWGLEASIETKNMARAEGQSLLEALQSAAQRNPWHDRFAYCVPHLANAVADAKRYFLYRTPQAPQTHGLELDLAHSRIWFQMACEGFLRKMSLDPKLVHYWPLGTGVHLYVPHTDEEVAQFQQRFPSAYAPWYFLLWEFAGLNSPDLLGAVLNSALAEKLPALNALFIGGLDDPHAIRESIRHRLYPELPPGSTETHLMSLYAALTDEQRGYYLLMQEGYRNLHSRFSWAELLAPEALPAALS